MPSDIKQIPPNTDGQFSDDERALMAVVRKVLEMHIEGFDDQSKHRALLAAASQLVDAAAEVAVQARPGIRVVELSILAERISSIACEPYQTSEN